MGIFLGSSGTEANVVLSDLLTFCGEIASPDSSGDTANREFVHWINAALARLYAEASWNHTLTTTKITILPQVDTTGVGIAQGSDTVVAVSFSSSYIEEQWDFHIDAEPDQTFRVKATAGGPARATFVDGDIWIQSTLSGGTGSWHKTIYPLPFNAKQIYLVKLMQTRDLLMGVVPHKFDLYKLEQPKEVGFPRIYTLRNNRVEFWPAPSTDYYSVTVSYRKAPARFTTATVTTTELDWPQEWEDLLQKAIQLEAAITLGEDSPIPYPLAKGEFEERLENYKSLDSKKDTPSGPMDVSVPNSGVRKFSYDYGLGAGPLADVGL